MEKVINKILELMAVFGIGVIIVLGVGFWLFYRLKKENETHDDSRKQDPPSKS